MDLKNIKETQKEGFGKMVNNTFTQSWIFEKPLEKFILFVIFILGIIKFFELMKLVFVY